MILIPVIRGAKFRKNRLYNCAPMLKFQNRTVYWSKRKKYEKKEEWHQRHNLTVLSSLPDARSGAVGYEVIY